MSNYKSNLQTNNSALSANNTDLQSLIEQANALPDATDGVELPALTNEGTSADLLSGKQLIDQEGNVVTGTIATKTASDLTASGATVTVPAGYYASQATKSVSTATQATPSITVSSSGLITAKSTQSAGYVSSGTKFATKKLTTKATTTYIPSTSNQTIASGTYLTGAQIIKGDANLVAGNIKSGVSVFGVNGSYEGSGSSSSSTPSNPSASTKAVNFRDYDGTILYSYTKDEALDLTSLPALPTQQGLTCQGWSWSLENMKEYVNEYDKLEIGAIYITDDGKTRIYITLQEGRTSPMLGVCPQGTVTVDWGDGSEPDILTGANTNTTAKWTPTHNYANAGDYVITLSVVGSMEFYGYNNANERSGILRYSSSNDGRNRIYHNAVQKIEIGNNVKNIANHAFDSCDSLSSINIPNSVTSIGNYAFRNCYSLSSINIPNGVTSIGDDALEGCHSLSIINIPNSVTNIGSSAIYQCYSLASINIPNSVKSIGTSAFCGCYSLASINIPNSVKSIGTQTFYGLNSLVKLRFNSATPPTVSASSAFSSIPNDCIISVPTGSLSAYTSATNYPSNSIYTYIEED